MTSLRQAIAGLRHAAKTGSATVHEGARSAGSAGGQGSDREQIEQAANEEGWQQRTGLGPGSDADGEYVRYISASGDRSVRAYYRHCSELVWAAWNEPDAAGDPVRRAGWPPDLKARLLDYIRGGQQIFKAAS